jgi:hypothetical protein
MKAAPNDTIPVEHNDSINAQILAISEDQIAGFVREPFAEIARRAGLPMELVLERITAMLRAGTIRRVRQTLLATNLAESSTGKNRCRFRLDVAARSVLGSCRLAID